MPVPQLIKQLVERFDRNLPSYKSGSYNETQVRQEFINPFFETLGWDVRNEKGYAEAYKDVIHEYSQKTTDSVEAPDYCFRIGGTRKFFVEAKKPSINLKDNINPAFQLRRYAWSAKLHLSILTDFEEFAVYDCRILPKKNDKASTGRIIYLNYKDYLSNWDEIESVFSRDSILKGSFDKYAESNKRKKGTAEVDDTFLKFIEQWREFLAKNIALRNTDLSTRELNFSVQKTIDRIIFLRICEDRGIEEYGQLMALQNGINVYKRMLQIFTRADEKYNSGLFHFENEKGRIEGPDELTPTLYIDDKILKDIIKNLYYPESPFEFSVLPADILGQVYEQFLGKVIRLTEGHQARIEDKPEVKKAGGVYYTPTYIVNYIVENTLGKILTPPISSPLEKGRIKEGFSSPLPNSLSQTGFEKRTKEEFPTPKKVSRLKILDPACGSGSFLIVAYQYLLDWHLKYYTNENETIEKNLSSKNPKIYQAANNDYRLTTTERKKILLNNIYGVDIDSQAVEVTKLSLLLKVLEGESEETLNSQLRIFHERALPDLGSNIKCGNSLIGPDFYDQMEMNFLDDEEKLRINVFDWEKEFPQVFRPHPNPLLSKERKSELGGFDVVIGNPPYYGRASGFSENEKKYIQDNFVSSEGKYETYQLFIEKALSLLKINGLHSYITPQTWLSIIQSRRLREFIKNNFSFNLILYSQKRIFKVSVDNIIYIIEKTNRKDKVKIIIYNNDFLIDTANPYRMISQGNLYKEQDLVIDIFGDKNIFSLENKIRQKCVLLGDICYVKDGVKVVGPAKEFAFSKVKIDGSFFPMITGKDIMKYNLKWNGLYCCRDKNKIEKRKATDIRLREEFIFSRPKIVLRKTGANFVAAIDVNNFYYEQSLFSISLIKENFTIRLELISGIINSKLANYLLKANPFSKKETFPQIRLHWLKKFPIPLIQTVQQNEKLVSKIISNVNIIMDRIMELKTTKTPQEKTALQRQIELTDKQIDQLVYQ
ncbi:MAG: TaqI-like C-terminal specificity domain-containing protein, partial [Ignavibacteriaceae bacterium]